MKVLLFLSRFLSVVFHPLLMVFFSVLLVLYGFDLIFTIDQIQQIILLTILFLFTFVFPVLFVLFMKKMGLITDLQLHKKEERLIPYVFTAAFYLFTAFHLYNKTLIDPLIYKLIINGAVVIILTALVNIKYKISAHVIACCALLGFTAHLCLYYNEIIHLILLIVLTLISGIVASARLFLRAHDSFEITHGSLLGFLLGALAPIIIL